MKRKRLLVAAGALITVVGVIWTLQGIGVIGGSVMTGKSLWAIVGPVVGVAGLVMIAAGLRGPDAPRAGPGR